MLEKCFQPVRIGKLCAMNRFVMAAQDLGYSEDGGLNQRYIDFYLERARGETGTIIVGGFAVHRLGKIGARALMIDNDRHMGAMRRLTDAIRPYGSLSVAQLVHAGRYARQRWIGDVAVTATGGPTKLTGEMARTLSTEEVEELVQAFSDGARRAKEAGFDAVQLSASTGYLVNQFISPVTNKRQDRYGGSFEGRLRFPLEIIEGIQRQCGHDYPIIVRICGHEYVPDGYDEYDARRIAQALSAAGAAAIDVQVGWHEATVPTVSASVPRGGFAHLAAEVKRGVSVPVIACNRINDPRVAEELIVTSMCDMVAMARALLGEPHFVRKAREGRFNDINSCIACGGCLNNVFSDQEVSCTINFGAGREGHYPLVEAPHKKTVAVVGGGPAGLEAARVAATRGHRVILYEAGPQLGGQLLLASVPPHKEELANLLGYFTTQLKGLGVEVQLGKAVTPEDILASTPNVVIVASGARPLWPRIPGLEAGRVVTAWDVLRGVPTGANVVVIGGGQVGCETSEYLASLGKKVTIVEMLPRVCADMGPSTRWVLLSRLRSAGVTQLVNTMVIQVVAGGVVAVSGDSVPVTIPADSIVLSVGVRAADELVNSLNGKGVQVVAVGDAKAPHTIREAIEDGFRSAYEL